MNNIKKTIFKTGFVDDTPEELYCAVWEAHNEGNIRMSLSGYFDFTDELAGRNISTGISAGTITSYVVDGVTVTASIPMTFTLKRANFNTNTLPVITDKVLTAFTYSIEIVCTNASEISITDAFIAAQETPTQVDSYYNTCS